MNRTETPIDPTVGARVGDYRLLELMSERDFYVFRAQHMDNSSRAIVKTTRPAGTNVRNILGSPASALAIMDILGNMNEDLSPIIQRFATEARIMPELAEADPDLFPEVYDVIEDNRGRIAIIMEEVEGANLETILANNTHTNSILNTDANHDGIEETDVLSVTVQILMALQIMNDKHLVHADVKPGNVMVSAIQSESRRIIRAKLLDFGTIKAFPHDTPAPHRVLGTSPFMAPEVWRGQGASPKSDLYSLGIMLDMMLAGRKEGPYTSSIERHIRELGRGLRREDDEEIHLSCFPDKMPDWISPELQEIVERLLHKHSPLRPPSAESISLYLLEYVLKKHPHLIDQYPFTKLVAKLGEKFDIYLYDKKRRLKLNKADAKAQAA